MVPLGLGDLDPAHGGLAAAAVLLGVKGDLLALDKPADASALQRGRMHKHVFASILRLDEAEALLLVVKFNCALSN